MAAVPDENVYRLKRAVQVLEPPTSPLGSQTPQIGNHLEQGAHGRVVTKSGTDTNAQDRHVRHRKHV